MKGFSFYAAVSGAVATVAAVVALLSPLTTELSHAALLGIGLAGASGALALLLKRRAMATDGLDALTGGMKALGLTVGMRVLVLTAGLVFVVRHGEGAMGFVVGFFAVYLAQQWLEISYLLTEQKRHSQLSKVQTP